MSWILHFCRKFLGTNPRFPERLELFPGLKTGMKNLVWRNWRLIKLEAVTQILCTYLYFTLKSFMFSMCQDNTYWTDWQWWLLYSLSQTCIFENPSCYEIGLKDWLTLFGQAMDFIPNIESPSKCTTGDKENKSWLR